MPFKDVGDLQEEDISERPSPLLRDESWSPSYRVFVSCRHENILETLVSIVERWGMGRWRGIPMALAGSHQRARPCPEILDNENKYVIDYVILESWQTTWCKWAWKNIQYTIYKFEFKI